MTREGSKGKSEQQKTEDTLRDVKRRTEVSNLVHGKAKNVDQEAVIEKARREQGQ